MPDANSATAPAGAAEAAFGPLAATAPTGPDAVEAVAEALVASLTQEERIGILSGDGAFISGTRAMSKRYNGAPIVAGAVPRLGLPGIRFTDGPRGVVMYHSTAFPSPMARAATFDPALEERIGDAIGVEARTQGANLFAGVCINLLRHPAWGRAQETYGEDPHLLGEMGAALVRGAQRHVMACVKHYAANSMENSRNWLDVEIAEEDLRDLYLPHFKRCVDEGVAGVMTAYNKVNGQYCGHHHHLVTDILKGDWGFDGFVMSDFTLGVRSARAALQGGLDLEMPYGCFFKRLPGLVARGRVEEARITDAATRLVRAQLRFASRGEPERYRAEVVAGTDHRALAREAARRSMTLLRNEPVAPPGAGEERPLLPFDPRATRRLAVIGWLAHAPNLGDLGSSQVHPPTVVTLLDGLNAAGGRLGVEIRHHDGRDVAGAAALAASCDAAVVVAGSSFRDEGEWIIRAGGDRESLRLHPHDEALAVATAGANPRTAVVLMGGCAFVTDAWRDQVPAVVMAWYPGMEGGHAVADVLFGEAEPEGRLPCTWPAASNRLPPFRRFARRIRYGPLHGYRLMESDAQEPAHWFGHGLGYSTIDWTGATWTETADGGDGSARATVAVTLTNTGDRPGAEVVQVYVPEVLGTHRRPLRTLRAFERVELAPGERREVRLTVAVPPGCDRVWAGPSADPTRLQEAPRPSG